ncbi:MAG: 50S ribosomal protein L15 [Candidatus Cloacimonetes bacterium]|jgi:large subunit ribosomal protein L15|nr:50S ribosomal protein L15 [Candidatus Cloacimonadota bacterium]MBT6993548.1 50S ribosomal protein L15 [Candidatus Cloacimonadota bacterium]MBT7470286.1 50S ribosomal protein L15 [Candidatus Cloacimonadota bacterium]
MKLHEMKRPKIKHKKRLGKGEGSGFGKQAGKGHKGQKSRSGGNIPLWFEGGQMPLQRRVPKRGFTNIFKKHFRIVNLETLQQFDDTDFDIEKIESLNLVRKLRARETAPIKILAKGGEEFKKTINIKANSFSKTAKELIEKNGGKAEVV